MAAVNVPADTAVFFSEHLAQRLRAEGLQVITQREVGTLLGTERQRQLLGCSDDGSECMAELAAALDADGTLIVDLARLDGLYLLNLKVLSAGGGIPLAEHAARAGGDRELLEALEEAAHALAEKLAVRLGRRLDPGGSASASGLRGKAWLPAVAGGVLAGLGALALSQANAAHQSLRTETFVGRPGLAESTRKDGELYQALAWTGFGLGAAGLVTAAAMGFSGTSSPVLEAGLTRGGGWVGLTAVIP